MNRAWMSAESPYTKFQVGSDAAQFLTDTGTFFFSPADGMLDQLRAQRERILTDPSARREAQRQDQDGYTVERFFIGSLDQGSRVRLRTALAPPDATRYEHSSSTRAVRRDAPTPAAPPRPIEPPKFSVPAAAPTGPDLSLSRLPAVVPVPPAPITALPVPPPDRSKPVGVLSSITLPSSAQAKVPPAPVEPYKIQVRLDGAVVLSQPGAAINGQPVALNKLTGQAVYSYSIPGGPSYELRWSDPDKQRLLLTRDGSPVALNEPDAFTLVRLRNFLPSGARLALAVGIVADSEALFEERATAVNESVSAAGVVRPIDLEWVGPGETASSAFMSSNQLRDKVLLDEGAFDGPRLVDAQGMGSQIKSAAARETRVLETLLRFIQSAEARGQALDDAAIDAWMDVVTGPGALPAVEPMKIEVRSGGYAFRAAAELPRVSAETAVVKLATAFTGSDSYASARENALEAARSLEQVLRSAPVSEGPEDPTAAVRSEVSRALKKLSALRAASAAKRAELNSGFGPGIGEDGGKIYIEEALFMEDQAFFESEDRTLSERLRTAGKDIRRVIVVELTERWEALAPEERVSAYRTERNIRGDFDVMFLDPKDGGTVFGDGGKHHALLTRYASPLANSALPQHLSVIEPIRVESASYAGVLFAAARLLIEDNDRLPGMKKFAAGRYFYLPPLGAGDLLRALIGARLSAEAAATSA